MRRRVPVREQPPTLTGITRRRIIIASSYVAAGLFALGSAWALGTRFWGGFPNVATWLFFAAAFVALEMRAVEVNDRLFQSSSVMVALTAGVVFSLGQGSAALGLAMMAALGPLVVDDVRQKRWFQPLANFGQMVVTAAAVGLFLDVVLSGVGRSRLVTIALLAIAASLIHTLFNGVLVWLAVRFVYGTRNFIPWSGMSTLASSHFTMGLLGGLLGATFLVVDRSVLPLLLMVYLIGHWSLSGYSQLREAHEATIRGFIKALEAKDLYTRGHTERVAYFAQLVGKELAFTGTQLERLRWASLIHDVGKLAVPGELIRKKGRLSDDEYVEMTSHARLVEEILAEVDFLHPMVEIASGHHAHYDGNSYGGSNQTVGKSPSLESSIVAVADSFDAMTSTRSYRMALTQKFAFSELRSQSGKQFHPDVVNALERALTKAGERYGSLEVDDEELARRLAEQEVVRARS
jgi:HD-GYP domain-containing protein (c-di-GMP phosphodiesterase class II)